MNAVQVQSAATNAVIDVRPPARSALTAIDTNGQAVGRRDVIGAVTPKTRSVSVLNAPAPRT